MKVKKETVHRKKTRKKKQFNLNGYIFGALRRIWRWDPARKKALERCLLFNGNYNCEKCGGRFSRKQIHVDHVFPVIHPDYGFVDWNMYIRRLFVSVEYLQVLCKKCHKEKTKEENKLRRKHK